MISNLEAAVQLHESIEIDYVVTHYTATLFTHNGDIEVAVGKGQTISEAVHDLEYLIRELRFNDIYDLRSKCLTRRLNDER